MKALENSKDYDYLADIQQFLLEMDESSASEILVILGEELITTCCTGIIERAFRCLGTDLQEFLGSLDGVYDVLKLQDVKTQDEDESATGFVCAGEGELIFTAEKPVVAWLLLGSLKALTRMLYNVNVNIKIEPVEGESRRYRYFFSLAPSTESTSVVEETIKESVVEPQRLHPKASSNPADLCMSSQTFCKAFPWHFIMNENLELVQLGKCIALRDSTYVKIRSSSTGGGGVL